MGRDCLDTLVWQFELTWKLAQFHLPNLTDEACLWRPAAPCWTVRQDAAGRWRPDWSAQEPDPVPATSIAWLTWHMIWWWTAISGAVQGQAPPHHEAIDWPGSAESTRIRLDELAGAWRKMLAQLGADDLDRPVKYPWAEPRPLMLALAWCNAELMKNLAEIGAVRHLYAIGKLKG